MVKDVETSGYICFCSGVLGSNLGLFYLLGCVIFQAVGRVFLCILFLGEMEMGNVL